jgi:hypothetical protein
MGGGAASSSLSSSGWTSGRSGSTRGFLLFALQKEKKLIRVSIREVQEKRGLTSYHHDLSGYQPLYRSLDERKVLTQVEDSSNPTAVELSTQTSRCLSAVSQFR